MGFPCKVRKLDESNISQEWDSGDKPGVSSRRVFFNEEMQSRFDLKYSVLVKWRNGMIPFSRRWWSGFSGSASGGVPLVNVKDLAYQLISDFLIERHGIAITQRMLIRNYDVLEGPAQVQLVYGAGNREKICSLPACYRVDREFSLDSATDLSSLNSRPYSQSHASIHRFCEEYLEKADRRFGFVGRIKELQFIDDWFAAPDAQNYLFVGGEAGKGKSALLVNWMHRAKHRDDVEIVFAPISTRHGTSNATYWLKHLAQRMSEITGLCLPMQSCQQDLVDVVSTSLRTWEHKSRTLLLLLDGLDENYGWQPNPAMFPQELPRAKVIVSARGLVEKGDCLGLLEETGLSSANRAARLQLNNLDHDELEQAIGHEVQSNVPALAAEAFRITDGGDPLLISLLADELESREEKSFDVDSFGDMHCNIDSFVQRWWREQQTQWDRSRLEVAKQLLGILCAALGPLSSNDLVRLLSEFQTPLWTLDEILPAMRRWIIGDDAGYSLSHPRILEYFRRSGTEKAKHLYDQRFISWGRETLELLRSESLEPSLCSPYLVKHLATHLERAPEGAQLLWMLLTAEWADACGESFQEGIPAIKRAIRSQNQSKLLRDEIPDIASEIRASLVASSFAGSNRYFSAELILVLVEKGIWSPYLAIAAASTLEATIHVHIVLELSAKLGHRPMLIHFENALERVASIESESLRTELFAKLATSAQRVEIPHSNYKNLGGLSVSEIDSSLIVLTESGDDRVAREPVRDQTDIESKLSEALSHCSIDFANVEQLMPSLSDEQLANLFGFLEGNKHTWYDLCKSSLIHALPFEMRDRIVGHILPCYGSPRDDLSGFREIVSNVAPIAEANVRWEAALLYQIDQADDFATYIECLSALVPWLSPEGQRESIESIFEVVQWGPTEEDRLSTDFQTAFGRIAPYLSQEELIKVLDFISGIDDSFAAVALLGALYRYTSEPFRSQARPSICARIEAIDTKDIAKLWWICQACTELALSLELDESRPFLRSLLLAILRDEFDDMPLQEFVIQLCKHDAIRQSLFSALYAEVKQYVVLLLHSLESAPRELERTDLALHCLINTFSIEDTQFERAFLQRLLRVLTKDEFEKLLENLTVEEHADFMTKIHSAAQLQSDTDGLFHALRQDELVNWPPPPKSNDKSNHDCFELLVTKLDQAEELGRREVIDTIRIHLPELLKFSEANEIEVIFSITSELSEWLP